MAPSATRAASGIGAPIDTAFIRAYTMTRRFRLGAPVHPLPTPDGKAVLFLRSPPRDPRQALFETDLASGATREVLSPETIARGAEALSPQERARRERLRIVTSGFTSFEITKDSATVIVSLSGRLFAVTRATGDVRELPTGEGAAIDPRVSPDGKEVAYVQANDVHAVALAGGKERAITRGGSDLRTHGLSEFVAAEELGRDRGFWWSPDGASILFEEADLTPVTRLAIADPANPAAEPERLAYPMAGTSNAIVKLGIASARGGGAVRWITWDRDRFPYVATVTWSSGAPPTIYVMDRLQKNGLLLAADPATGTTRELVQEHDDAWLDLDESVPKWLPDGSAFLWSSEREGGAARLELRDAKGALVRVLAPGAAGYARAGDIDPITRAAIFDARDDATHTYVARVALEGGAITPIVRASGGSVSATFGEAHGTFVSTETALTSLPRTVARTLDGAIGRELPTVREAPPPLPRATLERAGDDAMNVIVVRPRAFTEGRTYPVIDEAYGGPGVQVVLPNARNLLLSQWIADAADAIVVLIDAKGTPGRGRDWERASLGKVGTTALEGHVAALRALGQSHPEMDLSKVGIYGWSFGGYLASLAALRHPELFKVAVSIAPVSDLRDYDTAYTERYMGLPAENARAYDDESLLTWARLRVAAGAQAPRMLIAHGTADDNVYFTHSLKLADALERGGRPFELLPMAGMTHTIASPELQERMWFRAAEVLRETLRGAT
jgi:dipeptidyl-peptidase-4